MAAAVAVMVHTNMPAYPAVLAKVARVLRPGGALVHWTRASWTDRAVQAGGG